MDAIRVGVIGSGYWGPNLIRNFVDLPASEVVAVADLRESRLEYVKQAYPGIKCTTDYQDLFAMGLDAAVVATPPTTHFRFARECLERGLHVLVEKPLALSSREAASLNRLAESWGLTLMVGHTFEYNPAVRALKDIVQSGALGRVYYIDAERVNLGLFQPGLNVLWDLAPHDVSILRYILGQDPLSVCAQGWAYIFEGAHDIAYLHLRYPNDILAHIHVSWLHPSKVRRITVVGSKKMVVYDDVETLEKIKIYDKGVEALPYTDTFGDFQCSYRYGDVTIPYIKFVEPLRLECQHFLDSIANGTRPQSCGRVGQAVVRVLELAERSLQNGGQVQFVESEDAHELEDAPV